MNVMESTVSKFSPYFTEITAPNPLPVIANRDFTAFIVPVLLDPQHIHWRLQVFLMVDYYDGMDDGEPDKPVLVNQDGVSERMAVVKRGVKQLVIDAQPYLRFIEDILVTMNNEHFFTLMDGVEGYMGPTVIRGIAIKPMPQHAAAIIESEM